VAGASAIWTLVVQTTDGVYFRLWNTPVSSHHATIAVLLAVISVTVEWYLSHRLGELSLMVSGWQRMQEWLAAAERVPRQWQGGRHLGSIFIALTAVVVNLAIWLVAPPFWLDEETIALNIRDRGFTQLAGPLWLGQSAPLGWLVLERAALLAFGTGEIVLRLVPLLFGLATFVVALMIGRRWMGVLGTAVLVLCCAFGTYLAHYRFEVKHYTADAFWALALPALAVWVVEADAPQRIRRRLLLWWVAATVGQSVANGALLVTPAVALLLVASLWRRHGAQVATVAVAFGGIWLAFFAGNYVWSVRGALQSPHLHNFWAEQLAPITEGPLGFARFIAARLPPLARNPAGTEWWVMLWTSAITGFLVARRRLVGRFFACAPVTALILSPLVPMHERLALWIVPATYVGIALLVDRLAAWVIQGLRRRNWLLAAAAVSMLVLQSLLVTDVVDHGRRELMGARWSDSKHRLNDRLAVEWLMQHHRPGDTLISTRLAWPALWWYGGIRAPDAIDGRTGTGSAMYQVEHQSEPGCSSNQLREALAGHRRVLVYIGFRDVPPGFDDLLLERLDELGRVAALREWAALSRAAVIDLHTPGAEEITFRLLSRPTTEPSIPLGGCVAVKPAVLW
jgi:hypothetical protein